MSDKLPAVSGKDLVRVLQKAGWVVTHVRGSLHQLTQPATGERITIAVHSGKDMRRWLVKRILDAAKVSVEEFRKLL